MVKTTSCELDEKRLKVGKKMNGLKEYLMSVNYSYLFNSFMPILAKDSIPSYPNTNDISLLNQMYFANSVFSIGKVAELTRLLMIPQTLNVDNFTNEEVEIIDQLVSYGILEYDEEVVVNNQYMLIVYKNMYFFVDPRSYSNYIFSGLGDTYIGVDSYMLNNTIDYSSIKQNDRCLDLCTGTGFIAINLGKYSGEVVATDISPYALKTSKYNIVLNDCESVDLRDEELRSTISRNEKYNIITCNPPFVPVLFNCEKIPTYGAGTDKDGLGFYREIIEKLPIILAENGICYLVGEFLGNNNIPYFYEELVKKYAHIMAIEFRIEIEKSFDQYAREYSNLMYFLDRIPREDSIQALKDLGFDKTYIGTITLRLNKERGCTLINKMNPSNCVIV